MKIVELMVGVYYACNYHSNTMLLTLNAKLYHAVTLVRPIKYLFESYVLNLADPFFIQQKSWCYR